MPPRFFVDTPLNCNAEIELSETLAHHLRVLRLKEGDALTLFNGSGGEFQARLSRLEKRSAFVNLLDFSARECELPFKINLIQAIAGGNKMDWLIEKAVELGVHSIQPLQTQRGVVRLNKERESRRQTHWHALICAACEQCGRNTLPKITPVLSLQDWLAQQKDSLNPQNVNARQLYFSLSPRANLSLSQAISHTPTTNLQLTTINILIGPEGGLTEEEEALTQAYGLQLVHFGSRILRCETAGLAIIAAITALLGAI